MCIQGYFNKEYNQNYHEKLKARNKTSILFDQEYVEAQLPNAIITASATNLEQENRNSGLRKTDKDNGINFTREQSAERLSNVLENGVIRL